MCPMMNHAYNFSLAHTPHLDALSRTGLTFTRAYCQYSFCSPSRNSFMSGRRPDTTRVWEFVDNFREEGIGKNWTALPQWFKRHGYLSLGGGKLFHRKSPSNDYPNSWSEQFSYFPVPPSDYYTCNFSDATALPHKGTAGGVSHIPHPQQGAYCAVNVDKDESILTDQKIRDNCINHLKTASEETLGKSSGAFYKKPFFIACGFIRPHVPWHVPLEFFDLLPEVENIPLAAHMFAPQGMPMAAWHPPAGVKMPLTPAFNGTCNATLSRLYRRAYYASVSYSDYNVGKVLHTLDSLGFSNNTMVVVFGDHGWQLGEHDIWAKMTNFELGVHVPLIIRAPWKLHSVGRRTDVLAELVDLYPTLSALAGLPDPRSAGEMLNGTSLEPVFDEPNDTQRQHVGASIKEAAYSQFAKRNLTDVHPEFSRNETQLMGYSVRVSSWRYTAWFAFDVRNMRPITDGSPGSNLGTELYDHRGDSGLWLDFPGEERNLVEDEEHKAVVAELHQKVLDYIQLR
jgi:iduronate 2-sulfatase